MKTIEDKLQAAFELGKIAGAAETIDDEATRDCIYGSAAALFDGVLTEAGEDISTDAAYWKRKYEETLDDSRPCQEYPDGGGESAGPKTNLEWLCNNPEKLAERIFCPYDICKHDAVVEACGEDACRACLLDWLFKEATPDD